MLGTSHVASGGGEEVLRAVPGRYENPTIVVERTPRSVQGGRGRAVCSGRDGCATDSMKRFKKKLMIIGKILAFLGLSGCVPATSGVEKIRKISEGMDNPKISILFIGNSYSFGVPREFARLAKSKGKQVSVNQSTIGGWTLKQHMEQPETLEKLRSRKWDVIVIQDHSLNPGSGENYRRSEMDPGVKFFADEARAIGAVPLLYQTWGRRDGFPPQGDNFYEMNERVRNGYRRASERAGGVSIVPVGDAWEREFRANRGAMLYHEDGSHPSAAGDAVTAAEFYRVIFGEV